MAGESVLMVIAMRMVVRHEMSPQRTDMNFSLAPAIGPRHSHRRGKAADGILRHGSSLLSAALRRMNQPRFFICNAPSSRSVSQRRTSAGSSVSRLE